MVRVYLTEHEAHLKHLLTELNARHQVRGATVFRGVAGFGESGVIHSSSLLDLSLDLPMILEFFDLPERAQNAVDWLETQLGTDCIVCWTARINCRLDKELNTDA